MSSADSSSPRGYTALPGSVRAPVPGARAVGPVDPSETVSVTIRLRPRPGADDPQAAVEALGQTPPSERTYLTPEEFAARYGADPADVQHVVEFARAHGLAVENTDLGQRTVTLSGPASAMSAAFHVELQQYESPQGSYRGRVGPVHIPENLHGIIEGVFGLDNRRQARPHVIMPHRAAQLRAMHGLQSTGGARVATATSFFPPQIGQLYNFPAHLTGQGQTIGIIEFGGGYGQSDLETYFKALNLPVPQISAVSVDGQRNEPGKDPESDGEVLLDIEVVAALAPGAHIVVYFAPFTDQGWIDVIAAAVHDAQHHPSILSISWGYSEGHDIWTQQTIKNVNQAFEAAALMGMTICCASGDDGSQDQITDGHAHVDFPASSPYVLACGGTTIEVDGTSLVAERVWNNGPQAHGGGASGGGVSVLNALPAWQQGIVPPSVNPGHHSGRGVPDVAANADGNTGYTILVDGQELTGVGGTSAAAPLWAALIARINQQLGKPVGYLTPLLYTQASIPNALRDIIDGTNDPTGHIGGYNSGPGWDACTGWGSPDGGRLLAALSALGSGSNTSEPSGPARPPAPSSPAPSAPSDSVPPNNGAAKGPASGAPGAPSSSTGSSSTSGHGSGPRGQRGATGYLGVNGILAIVALVVLIAVVFLILHG